MALKITGRRSGGQGQCRIEQQGATGEYAVRVSRHEDKGGRKKKMYS